ncbi:M20/M25/M40 family metallo-hydrolase [Thermoleophilum album]|uniref:Acetylornithine deacetylase n=1 Tax=Thermoleophilum album TaxID=29539 RepID=A0A1H6FQ19_THEAL|nr:M20/M25/M40 family metallo-hydrolase [Thermoleophilum album]SEH12228.1 acetylornithine deacetylase [Thermoleophilum album]
MPTVEPRRGAPPLDEASLHEWLRSETLALARIASPSGREEPLAAHVERTCGQLGLRCQRVIGEQRLAGLVVTAPQFDALRSPEATELALCAHLDTIVPPRQRVGPPLAEDRWPARPYAGGGWLAGLGVLDDKGPVACALAALALARRRGLPPAAPVAVLLTCDEEEGGSGSALLARLCRPRRVVVLEPTELRICTRAAGAVELEVEFRGIAAHAAVPEAGDNAVERAARFVAALDELPLTQLRDPLLGPARASCLELVGGWPLYAVPDAARVRVEARLVPGCSVARAIAEVELAAARQGGRVRVCERAEPWSLPHSALAEQLAQALHSEGRPALEGGMHSWTDAHNFVAQGVRDAVVFGPGELALAHTPQERVELRELCDAARVLARLLVSESAPAASPNRT